SILVHNQVTTVRCGRGNMRENRPGRFLLALLLAVAARASAEPPPSWLHLDRVTPAIGRPEGGDVAVIEGCCFDYVPVRVFLGIAGKSHEAFVVSTARTQITIVTPAINLGTGQIADADMTVLNNAGTSDEMSATLPKAFSYQRQRLTPSITV